MKIYEIISEDINEGKPAATVTIRDAKKILTTMGFTYAGRTKGSHEIWKDQSGILFPVPQHGKELDFGVTKNLYRLMRDRGFIHEDFNLIEF